MIIQSLLDTDLYKFTMMQVVLHHFPGAQVEYKFRCRTPGVDLRPDLPTIRRELDQLCSLRFRDDELAYLRALRFLKSDFVDFLALFHFNGKYVSVGEGEQPGEIDITIRGPWLHTIMYEIPALAIVSEAYFRRTQPSSKYQLVNPCSASLAAISGSLYTCSFSSADMAPSDSLVRGDVPLVPHFQPAVHPSSRCDQNSK